MYKKGGIVLSVCLREDEEGCMKALLLITQKLSHEKITVKKWKKRCWVKGDRFRGVTAGLYYCTLRGRKVKPGHSS